MKLNPIKLPLAFAITAFSVTVLAAAEQDGAEPNRRRARPPTERRQAPPEGGGPLERILDPEQRAQLREFAYANREHAREVNQKLEAARREMNEVLFSEKLDEDQLKKRIGEIAKLEAERHFMRAKALAMIRPTLRPEQVERLRDMHARMGECAGRPLAGPQEGAHRQPHRPSPPEGDGDFHEGKRIGLPRPEAPRPPRSSEEGEFRESRRPGDRFAPRHQDDYDGSRERNERRPPPPRFEDRERRDFDERREGPPPRRFQEPE